MSSSVISSTTMDVINDAVDTALNDFNIDCGMFDYEFEIDYDNKVTLSNLTFTDTYDVVEAIIKNIEKQFKIISND